MAGPDRFPAEFRASSERIPSSEQTPGEFRATFWADAGQAPQSTLISLVGSQQGTH